MKMNKNLNNALLDLQEISALAYELFRYDLRNEKLTESELIKKAWSKARKWINSSQSLCFNKKPIDLILINDGESIKNFLKDKLGVKHE